MDNDHLATAVDWLDAYRSQDLEGVLSFFASDAALECACSGAQIVVGKAALRTYWRDQFSKLPAFSLEDLEPSESGATVGYRTPSGVLRIALQFNGNGQIVTAQCAHASHEPAAA
jgi:ketosteroid isomerase-like protein